MSKVPSLNYTEIIRALERDGWVCIRRRGSHFRMQKRIDKETVSITVPAHKPVKRSTLAHILKQARYDVEQFLKLL